MNKLHHGGILALALGLWAAGSLCAQGGAGGGAGAGGGVGAGGGGGAATGPVGAGGTGGALAEDLSECKLPHGVLLIPVLGTKEAEGGNLLKLSDGSFTTLPIMDADRKMLTGPQVLEKLRTSRIADLQYMTEGKGTLWAISGRISEQGSMYLFEATGKKFDAPMEIPGGRNEPTGMYNGILVGRTYLVQTMDIRYALCVLEKRDTGLVVQYVYQPDGTLTFDVPRGDKVALNAIVAASPATAGHSAKAPDVRPFMTPDSAVSGIPASSGPALASGSRPPTVLPPAAPLPALGPGDVNEPGRIILRSGAPSAGTGLEPSIDMFHHQRDQMVAARMAIVAAPAHTPQEIDRKVQAINDLVILHADEAADLLIAQISFLNTRSSSREFSQEAWLPCLAALKQLGKPASAAALKALRQMDLDAPGEGLEAPSSRAGLMATVVRGVEGPEVGDFILRQEMEKQTDPKRKAVYEYLLESTKK